MNAVYNYLISQSSLKSDDAAIQTLLFILGALEDCLSKTQDEKVEKVFNDTVLQYGLANGWYSYHKYSLAEQVEIGPNQVAKQIKQLKESGLVIVHTLPNHCFLEVVRLNSIFK